MRRSTRANRGHPRAGLRSYWRSQFLRSRLVLWIDFAAAGFDDRSAGPTNAAGVKSKSSARRRQVLVNRRLKVAQRADSRLVVERQILHHQHSTDTALRVDPELGVVDTGPAETTGAAVLTPIVAWCGHLKAKPELVTPRAQRKWPR